jgi:hypothetical protein
MNLLENAQRATAIELSVKGMDAKTSRPSFVTLPQGPRRAIA